MAAAGDEAWGVAQMGHVLPETVGPTPRSALVNWLYTGAKVNVSNSFSENDILLWWRMLHDAHGVELVRLELNVIETVDADTVVGAKQGDE